MWPTLLADHLSKKRLREKLMSLFQLPGSPDRAADYTTCLGQEVCLCDCMHISMSMSPDLRRSTANCMFTTLECTFSDEHTFPHKSLLSSCNLSHSHSQSYAYINQVTPLIALLSLTHTHKKNQVWPSEQATQWEWVIRPSESRPDLSLHIQSSVHVCFYESVAVSCRARATSHQMSPP